MFSLESTSITVTHFLLAAAVSLAAVCLSTVLSALAGMALAPRRQRRAMETRLADALLLGAAVQQWMRTPAAAGGRGGVTPATFDRLGLRTAGTPAVRRTASGRFRLFPVPGRRGATLVLGWEKGPADAVATLVVGALVQVQLPTIPWSWIQAQLSPPPAPAAPLGPPESNEPPPTPRVRQHPPLRPPRSRLPRPLDRRHPAPPMRIAAAVTGRAPARGLPPRPPPVLAHSHSPPVRLPVPPAVLREPPRSLLPGGSRRSAVSFWTIPPTGGSGAAAVRDWAMPHAPPRLEAWLRGPLPGVPALLQPVAHALVQSRAEIGDALTDFPADALWTRPAGVASVGFHLWHIAGVLDRLTTYARGESLTDAQFAALDRESESGGEADGGARGETVEALLAAVGDAVEAALAQLRETDPATLTEPRAVGRKRIPSTGIGLLVHAAEHTTRHTGQLIVTARVVRAARS